MNEFQVSMKIGYLGNVEHLFNVRSVQFSSHNRPEGTENSEKRTLTTSVGASNNDIHTRFNLLTMRRVHNHIKLLQCSYVQ